MSRIFYLVSALLLLTYGTAVAQIKFKRYIETGILLDEYTSSSDVRYCMDGYTIYTLVPRKVPKEKDIVEMAVYLYATNLHSGQTVKTELDMSECPDEEIKAFTVAAGKIYLLNYQYKACSCNLTSANKVLKPVKTSALKPSQQVLKLGNHLLMYSYYPYVPLDQKYLGFAAQLMNAGTAIAGKTSQTKVPGIIMGMYQTPKVAVSNNRMYVLNSLLGMVDVYNASLQRVGSFTVPLSTLVYNKRIIAFSDSMYRDAEDKLAVVRGRKPTEEMIDRVMDGPNLFGGNGTGFLSEKIFKSGKVQLAESILASPGKLFIIKTWPGDFFKNMRLVDVYDIQKGVIVKSNLFIAPPATIRSWDDVYQRWAADLKDYVFLTDNTILSPVKVPQDLDLHFPISQEELTRQQNQYIKKEWGGKQPWNYVVSEITY